MFRDGKNSLFFFGEKVDFFSLFSSKMQLVLLLAFLLKKSPLSLLFGLNILDFF